MYMVCVYYKKELRVEKCIYDLLIQWDDLMCTSLRALAGSFILDASLLRGFRVAHTKITLVKLFHFIGKI